MLGQELFKLGPRDMSGALIEGVTGATTELAPAGATMHTHQFQVPIDRVMLLTTASMTAFGAGVVSIISMTLRIDSESDLETFLHVDDGNIPALTNHSFNRDFNGVLLPPLALIRFEVVFAAFTLVGSSSAAISGVLLPRGNVGFARLAKTTFVA